MVVDWEQLSREFDAALLRDRVDFRARESLLYRRDDYKHRREMAHDLRNSEPFGRFFLDWKRDYQWAEDAWLFGRLTAPEFHRRVRQFDEDVRRAFEWSDRLANNATSTAVWTRWIRRWNRAGFVSRVGWQRWFELTKLEKENQARWLHERQRRTETAQQRAYLRTGHETLKQLRRVLRGQEALPQPESTQARSLPTS